MLLFCLPYAGGSKSIYANWKKYFNSSIEVFPIELKGRGERYNEGFYNNMEEAIDDIYELIKDKIKLYDYSIFGHSMGSILAYELYYKILSENVRKPKHIFFSAHEAPNVCKKMDISYVLPDRTFMEKVIDLGGTPSELKNNIELIELYAPILKNDFKLLDNYKYTANRKKINCDISVLLGKDDSVRLEDVLSWEKHNDKNFEIHLVEGNHFFISTNTEQVTNIINSKLKTI